MRHHRIRPVAAALCGLVAAVALLGAQTPPQEDQQESQPPVFKSGVDSVTVDVVVTDKKGQPVADLKADDFEIREDGKPQSIEAMRLIRIDDGWDDQSVHPILSIDDQRREAGREENRLLVIYLDDYHVRLGNSMAVREQLAQFVSQLAPHDIVAVAVPLLPAASLTFSRNHDATAGEIMNFVGRKYDYRPRNRLEEQYAYEPAEVQERLRNSWTIASLRGICEYMSSFRDGRKTLLYVSEGMSNTLPAGVKTMGFQGMPGAAPVAGPDPEGRAATAQYFSSVELLSDMQKVFRAATRTNTAIYTLDPRGLAVSEYSVADVVTASMDHDVLQQTTDMLRSLAEETDGRAIVGRNDFATGLTQMVKDNSTYYLLGYTSTAAPRDGKFHEIQVRVKRKDVDVRARKGYWAISPEEATRLLRPPPPPVPAAVTDALEALGGDEAARRGAVRVFLAAARGENNAAAVTLAWEAMADPRSDPLDRVDHLQVTATSASGETLFTGRADRDQAADHPLGQIVFPAPPGPVHVQIESENTTGRRLEMNDASIDVPDFTSPAATITMPFVYRARTARDLQQIRAAETPQAAATRSFSRAERILVRFDAYGPAGVVPTVTARLLNVNGAEVAPLPAPELTTGNTFEMVLALGPFPPGSYVVELTASVADDTQKRMVAVRVTG